ncbi:hypothetical protein HY3_16115 [Hyphomonas pacifica]|uniref:Uncharacterized protein n=1 Tax=Hyphomonas pacifica TaxID=1280941 RepID=A0A062TWV5_9PROT|nr:hypothetical protein HY2_15330 [Hyphomonas pacifica]RAN31903.1 hypothetical protein HY3_16115 [Hyphomonas pacifica]
MHAFKLKTLNFTFIDDYEYTAGLQIAPPLLNPKQTIDSFNTEAWPDFILSQSLSLCNLLWVTC